ncbi:M28 family metallopeptidase, partial [Vibrio parahaemolyticus]|nr:M28 family metallopeptidase [Vibrio parahaemolyticus]
HPSEDPAPGADDDGSGIAGVLTTAKYLSQYRGKFIHTIRFCFFNAEEVGLNGSKNYAATLRGTGAPIKAVLCMDMIGYNNKNPEDKLFEIH